MDIHTLAFILVFVAVIAVFGAVAWIVLDAQSKSTDEEVHVYKKYSEISHGKNPKANYYADVELRSLNTTILVTSGNTWNSLVPGNNYTLNCYTAFGGWYCK